MRSRFRQGLIVSQIALSVVLLSGSGLPCSQFDESPVHPERLRPVLDRDHEYFTRRKIRSA